MTITQIQPGQPDLVHVDEISYSAEYLVAGRPGSIDRLLLHPQAARRLRWAREIVRGRCSGGEQLDIHVWDAYRPHMVQQAIFDEYVWQLIDEGMKPAQAELEATTFVRHPQSVYPHGTGGTVDLTLLVNGTPADMGTAFDDFTTRAHREWFQHHPPRTEVERKAAEYRRLLRSAMESVGFVGIAEEWWHYEWGTTHWAAAKRCQPKLTESVHLGSETRLRQTAS